MRSVEQMKSPEMQPLEAEGYKLARQASLEGMVLLENHGGALPLKPGRVALFGYGARHTMVRGIGSGDITLRYETSVEKGLVDAGFEITSAAWLDAFDALYADYRRELRAELQQRSRETGIDELHLYYSMNHIIPCALEVTEELLPAAEDMGDEATAIYVLTRKEGEGLDNRYEKGEYLPSDVELASLRLLRQRFGKLILLLNVGSPVDMQAIRAIGPDAVLLIYQGTAEIGHAAVDLITGRESPSGRLPNTWALDYWDYPNSRFFGMNDDDPGTKLYREGLYIGYRYFDTFGKKPLYPFGYGLSYTTFRTDALSLKAEGSLVTLAATVTNTGDMAGQEVAQLYVSLPGVTLDQPVKQLVGYHKTEKLAPGEEETFTLAFAMEDLASFSEARCCYLLEAGDYVLQLGGSSDRTAVCGVVRLTGERVTRKTKHLFHRPVDFEVLTAPKRHVDVFEYAAREAVPMVEIAPDDIPSDGLCTYSEEPVDAFGGGRLPGAVNTGRTGQVILDVPADLTLDDVRSGAYSLEELVSTFSEEDLIHLIVGESYINPRYQMGSVSTHVIGACGETSNYFLPERAAAEGRCDRRIPYTVMADGPCGVRIIPHVQVRPDGRMVELDPVLNYEGGDFSKDPGYEDTASGVTDLYQYVTGLPIPVQIASTWNQALIHSLGDHVGAEMEAYGVDTLLAPGMNLHRNPLCGRNFEYYAEDPVLSALTAIAFVTGVEKHPGKQTCVKHFAANNQETLRYSHNSVVSERVMRDLYLKAFELTIKYAEPGTVMTSLNCVNGPHATNSRDLATFVLRDEWGYEGLIMTDWNTTSLQRGASTIGCVNAGDDLIMPGLDLDYERMRAALHATPGEGETLAIGALQRNAVNVLKYILRSGR